MKKYYVDDKEVSESRFTAFLALSLDRIFNTSQDAVIVITETIKKMLEDGHMHSYGRSGKVFKVREYDGTEDVYVSITAVTPNIDFKPTSATKSYIRWSPEYPVGSEIYYFGTLIPEEDLIKILDAGDGKVKTVLKHQSDDAALNRKK